MKRSGCRAAFPLLFLFVCILSGCAAEGLLSRLGFDTHDYRGEETLAVLDTEGEQAQRLAAMTRSLTVNTPYLNPFSGVREAAQACRDAVLNRMLEENYAQYAGNGEWIDRAAAAYPQMQISVIIPAADFESVVYATFGGSEKISNRSGVLFQYLDKIGAYTTAANPQPSEVTVTVLRLEETERTYRMWFSNRVDGIVSPEYFVLIVKRGDGSLYFMELEEV